MLNKDIYDIREGNLRYSGFPFCFLKSCSSLQSPLTVKVKTRIMNYKIDMNYDRSDHYRGWIFHLPGIFRKSAGRKVET